MSNTGLPGTKSYVAKMRPYQTWKTTRPRSPSRPNGRTVLGRGAAALVSNRAIVEDIRNASGCAARMDAA